MQRAIVKTRLRGAGKSQAGAWRSQGRRSQNAIWKSRLRGTQMQSAILISGQVVNSEYN